jgi:hypothetical protein
MMLDILADPQIGWGCNVASFSAVYSALGDWGSSAAGRVSAASWDALRA